MNYSKSLCDHVSKNLIQRIVEKKYCRRIPTEVSLAREFDVSVPTVKKAMKPLVKNGVVTRIPGKGTFVKDIQKARGMMEEYQQDEVLNVTERPVVVGVVLPGLNDAFSNRLLSGITQALSTHNAHALLGISQNDRTQESTIIRNFMEIQVDGLIIFPAEGEIYNEDIVRLSLDNFPIVLVDRWLPGIDVSRVVSEHASGTGRAVDYLCELGHRKIALVSVSSNSPLTTQSIIQRKTGFFQSFGKLGLEAEGNLIFTENNRLEREQNIEFIVEEIKSHHDLTALIGISADDTRLIFEATKRLGMRVPRDVSVIGFDIGNVLGDFDATFFEGGDAWKLAWLDQSEQLIGKEGADLVCSLISVPENKRVIEVPIVVRPGGSCAAPNNKTRKPIH